MKIPESYANLVQKTYTKVESRLKVLGYPLEQIPEAYEALVKDGSQDDLDQIMALRSKAKEGFNFKI